MTPAAPHWANACRIPRPRFPFLFYSNEGSPRGLPHVHVEVGGAEAKLWLRPEIRVAYNDGFDGKTLRELLQVVEVNRERIERASTNFFG